jgi:hypothetical protein
VTPSWKIESPAKPAAKSPGDFYSDRRLHVATKRERGAPFTRTIYTAEWDHPTRPGFVKKHHFDTRDEAIAALHGPSPFDLAQQLPESPEPSGKESWFICRA